jgi:hypothetical protein
MSLRVSPGVRALSVDSGDSLQVWRCSAAAAPMHWFVWSG